MSNESFEIVEELEATPARVFEAWTNADLHAEFTGARATGDATEGGTFTAWDGYIEGRHLTLTPGQLIEQSWRTSEFPDDAPDSHVEIVLEATATGTRVTLRHSEIPPGDGARYQQGWQDFYFEPLREWLASS